MIAVAGAAGLIGTKVVELGWLRTAVLVGSLTAQQHAARPQRSAERTFTAGTDLHTRSDASRDA